MSGPIVRSGPSPEFSKNWEQVFGAKKATAKKAVAAAKPAPQKPAKAKSAKKAKKAKKK